MRCRRTASSSPCENRIRLARPHPSRPPSSLTKLPAYLLEPHASQYQQTSMCSTSFVHPCFGHTRLGSSCHATSREIYGISRVSASQVATKTLSITSAQTINCVDAQKQGDLFAPTPFCLEYDFFSANGVQPRTFLVGSKLRRSLSSSSSLSVFRRGYCAATRRIPTLNGFVVVRDFVSEDLREALLAEASILKSGLLLYTWYTT